MWNLLSNNYICDEKALLRTSQIHLEKLIKAKTYINNKSPITPSFFKNQTTLKESIRKKERKIKIGNYIMYKKLSSMENILSPYSKSRNLPKYCPPFDKKKYDFAQKEKQRTISSENSSFFKRFVKEKSFYPILNFAKKSVYEEYIKHNISKAKYLPKISLNLCTFKEFKKNLLRDNLLSKDNSRDINIKNLSNITNNKTNKKIIHLNNTFNKENNNNNKLFINNIKKKNSKDIIYNIKRCHSVKNRNSYNTLYYE